jgi:cation transport ATPase
MSAVTAPLRKSRETSPDPRRHLRVVDEPVVRHTLAYALVMIAIVGASVFGAVTLNALAAGAAVEARGLEAQVSEAERAYAQLVADVAALEDPARIRETALDLGLVQAGPSIFVPVDRNLPADGAVVDDTRPVEPQDQLKPLLSVER